MIVNFKEMPYAIVELDEKDMNKLNKGEDVMQESRAGYDNPILIRVYCSNPQSTEEDHD